MADKSKDKGKKIVGTIDDNGVVITADSLLQLAESLATNREK